MDVKTIISSANTRLLLIIGVTLAAITFAINVIIAFQFEGAGALDQYDVIFDADTVARIECVVENRCGGRSSFSHPNLALFLNPPIQVTAWLLKHLRVFGSDTTALRRSLCLLVCPFASAVKILAVFVFLLLLGLTRWQSLILTLLCLVSFSQLIFGSIPETFALSGCLLAVAYLFTIQSMRTEDRRFWPWVLLGILIAGIAVTNLLVILTLFITARLYIRTSFRRVLLSAVLLIVLAAIPTATLPNLFRDTYQLKEVSITGGNTYTKRWMKTLHASERALKTPVTWGHTFAAPEPDIANNSRAIREKSKFRYRFTLAPENILACRNPLTIIILLLLGAGALAYLKAARMGKWICCVSLTIIAFNWILHSIWGVELFLYSQHWHTSLVILLAGPFLWDNPPVRKTTWIIVVLLICAVVAENSATLSAMLAKLQSVQPSL